MIFLVGLAYVLGFYLFMSLSIYSFILFKNWEYTGYWLFEIKDGYIGVFTYPKWLLGWVEWITKSLKG